MFTMRFAMRSKSAVAKDRSALYRATLDMCDWADGRGGMAMVSQHHGVEDGYLPSPLTLAAAIAARALDGSDEEVTSSVDVQLEALVALLTDALVEAGHADLREQRRTTLA